MMKLVKERSSTRAVSAALRNAHASGTDAGIEWSLPCSLPPTLLMSSELMHSRLSGWADQEDIQQKPTRLLVG